MEMYEFIESTKDKHLTISDIEKLKKGDKLKVVMWDRNFEEYWIWGHAYPNKKYPALKFFKRNIATLTYVGNYQWDIHFEFGQIVRHPIHIDVSCCDTQWKWVPVKEGTIYITNETLENNIDMHWNDFPKDTRVGWRGPMILTDHLKSKKVFYAE